MKGRSGFFLHVTTTLDTKLLAEYGHFMSSIRNGWNFSEVLCTASFLSYSQIPTPSARILRRFMQDGFSRNQFYHPTPHHNKPGCSNFQTTNTAKLLGELNQ